MIPIDFPESNLNLRAGSNPQTTALRVAVCVHIAMPGDFYVSKWTLQESELEAYRLKLSQVINSNSFCSREELIEKIVKILPEVYLAAMHTPPPVILSSEPVFDFLKPIEIKKSPNSYPNEN